MATIHDEIDNYLAADLHGQLLENERSALHTHLVECATCRKAHQETKAMNKILEGTLAQEKPDPAFEQRMLASFRNRIPQRSGFVKLLVDLMRLRALQFTAVAAILVALVQMGRMVTGENATALRPRYAKEQSVAQPPQLPESQTGRSGSLAKSDEVAAGKPDNPALEAPPPPSEAKSKFHDEAKAYPATVAPAKVAQPEADQRQAFVARRGISNAQEAAQSPIEAPAPAQTNRKLIRNAKVELEIISFDDAVQKITAFANEEHGYVATTSSEKQANGKLRGQVVVKVLPENLDHFLQKVRGLGELKNQALGTEDVTKAYLDTDARLKNARVMEQRLIEMLQGKLKYWDSQVQFATVTISLAEKDMEEPAAFLLKERAQLALYAPEVEKIYNDIKALASPKTQITNAQLDRDNT